MYNDNQYITRINNMINDNQYMDLYQAFIWINDVFAIVFIFNKLPFLFNSRWLKNYFKIFLNFGLVIA